MDASKFIPGGLYSYLDQEAPSCLPYQAGYFRIMGFENMYSGHAAEIICEMHPFVPKVALEVIRRWYGTNHGGILHRCVVTANAPAFRLVAGIAREQSIISLSNEIVKFPGLLEALAGSGLEILVGKLPGHVSPKTYEIYRRTHPWFSWSILSMAAVNIPLMRHLAKRGELFTGLNCRAALDLPAGVWHEAVKLGFSKEKIRAIYRSYECEALYQLIEGEI